MSNSLREKATLPRSHFGGSDCANRIFRFFTLGGICARHVEDAPTGELLKKGTRRGDAVSRYRPRLGELCCRSAPGEVGTVAQFAGEGESKAAILALAERGTADFDTMMEQGSGLEYRWGRVDAVDGAYNR